VNCVTDRGATPFCFQKFGTGTGRAHVVYHLAPAKLSKLSGAWQVSQAALIGTWSRGGVVTVNPAKLLPVA